MNILLVFMFFFISCGKENELTKHENSSSKFFNDQIFSKNSIKVFDEIKLNEPIETINLSKWKLLNEKIQVNERTTRYSYNSSDDDLTTFYNLKFDYLEIKTFNDSIFQLELKVSGPENSYYSSSDKTLKREHINEALKIFEEKYGPQSIDLSTDDQNIRKIWSQPEFSIEIFIESQKIPVFTPDEKSKNEYNKIFKNIDKNSSLKEKFAASIELDVKRSNYIITGSERVEQFHSLNILFTSKYLEQKERKIFDSEKSQNERIDSMKKAEARKKL